MDTDTKFILRRLGFTWKTKQIAAGESVFIRVNPWFHFLAEFRVEFKFVAQARPVASRFASATTSFSR